MTTDRSNSTSLVEPPSQGSLSRMVVAPRGLARIEWHWTTAVALAIVIIAAAVLRIAAIGEPGFNSDESVYAGQAAALVGEQPWDDLFSLFRAHPLLLQLTVGTFFKFVGVGDVAARVLVAPRSTREPSAWSRRPSWRRCRCT
jgi:hypothetical protein